MEMKVCRLCPDGKEKPITNFSWKNKAKGIRQDLCKPCAVAYARGYRAQRQALLGEEAMHAYHQDRYQKSRAEQRDYHKQYYQDNAKALKAKQRAWYQANREEALRQGRIRQLRDNFGLTPEAYEAMLVTQDGHCALCGKLAKRLMVDHCHTTGIVRALLCVPCNSFLGRIDESIEIVDKIRAYILRCCPHKAFSA
jgi:Autographiviridae endonuclease VII